MKNFISYDPKTTPPAEAAMLDLDNQHNNVILSAITAADKTDVPPIMRAALMLINLANQNPDSTHLQVEYFRFHTAFHYLLERGWLEYENPDVFATKCLLDGFQHGT